MKIILGIITALAFFIGVMVNKMALSIGEQIYAALYYIMALIAFCTLSVLFDGKFTCSCNWLRRECGLPEKDLEDENDENAVEEELTKPTTAKPMKRRKTRAENLSKRSSLPIKTTDKIKTAPSDRFRS